MPKVHAEKIHKPLVSLNLMLGGAGQRVCEMYEDLVEQRDSQELQIRMVL